MIVGGET